MKEKREVTLSLNQNLPWKLGQQTPSVGTLLAYLETTQPKSYFFNLRKQELIKYISIFFLPTFIKYWQYIIIHIFKYYWLFFSYFFWFFSDFFNIFFFNIFLILFRIFLIFKHFLSFKKFNFFTIQPFFLLFLHELRIYI